MGDGDGERVEEEEGEEEEELAECCDEVDLVPWCGGVGEEEGVRVGVGVVDGGRNV